MSARLVICVGHTASEVGTRRALGLLVEYVRVYQNLTKFFNFSSTTILVLFYTVFKSRETETQTETFRVH